MDYKTEVGTVLQKLGYREDICKRFEDLAMFLTCIPISERKELLGSIIWYFDFKLDEKTIEKFDCILTEINK